MTQNIILIYCTLLCYTCNAVSFSIPATTTATLTPQFTNSNGASVVSPTSETQVSFWPSPSRWTIKVQQTNTWHIGLELSNTNWGFHPNYVSAITFQIYSPTVSPLTYDDIMIAFTTQNVNDYVAMRLFMDNSEPNRISPYCDISSDPSSNPMMNGNLFNLPNTNRICDVMNDCTGINYDQYKPLNINPTENNGFPITITVMNYPNAGYTEIYFKSNSFSSNFEQKCGFANFPSQQGLQMVLGVNSIGQTFDIIEFQLNYYIFVTTNPTKTPSDHPTTATPTTANPTTPPPTNPQISELITIWHQEMSTLSTGNWTTTRTTIERRDGSDGGCPPNAISTCWAVCSSAVSVFEQFAYRSASTNGFKNIAITYSLDPWSAQIPNSYCEISYSIDNNNWISITPQYDSAHHIVDNTIFLDTNTWDTNNVAIRVVVDGDASTCCYFSNWYLLGKLITDSPTINPTINPTIMPTTDIPTTYNPTTNMPTTDIPTTNNPTTNIPTTISPSTTVPTTVRPTMDGETLNPTTVKPTTSIPTLIPTTTQPSTDIPTTVPSDYSFSPTVNDAGQVIDTTVSGENTGNGNGNGKAEVNDGFIQSNMLYVILGVGVCCVCIMLIGFVLIRKKKKQKNVDTIDNMVIETNRNNNNGTNVINSNIAMTSTNMNHLQNVASTSNMVIEDEGNDNGFTTKLASLNTANELLMDDTIEDMNVMNDIHNDYNDAASYVTKGGPDMNKDEDEDIIGGHETLGGMHSDINNNNDDEFVPAPPEPPMHNEMKENDNKGTVLHPALICIICSSEKIARLLIKKFNLIMYATSFGGVETTIDLRSKFDSEIDPKCLRLSVGLESYIDIINDFKNAFKVVQKELDEMQKQVDSTIKQNKIDKKSKKGLFSFSSRK
eukprot:156854_1